MRKAIPISKFVVEQLIVVKVSFMTVLSIISLVPILEVMIDRMVNRTEKRIEVIVKTMLAIDESNQKSNPQTIEDEMKSGIAKKQTISKNDKACFPFCVT